MSQLKIVIVADDIDNLDVFCCEFFDKYDLHPLSDEHFTLSDIEAIMPHLIILDTEMENIDIFSIYQQKQLRPKLIEVPILFSTGLNNTDHQQQLRKLGINTYITKPYDTRIIDPVINKCLEKITP